VKRLLAVALILIPTLARAEFTDLEKREIAEHYRACELDRAGVKELGFAANIDSTPEARSKLGAAGRWASTANDTCVRSQAWLLHLAHGATASHNAACLGPDWATPHLPLPSERASAMACAKERLQRAVVEIAQAEASLDAYRPLASSEAATHLDLARKHFTGARTLAAGVDMTLPYLEPFPSTYPRQFAVHGEYSKAQLTLVIGQSYFNGLGLQAWEEYSAGAGPDGIRLGRRVRALMFTTRLLSYAQDSIQKALILGARSGLTDAEIAWSDVDRAFRANELLSDPIGGASDSLHFAYAYAVSFFAHPVRAGFTDGWRFFDAWFYWFFNGGLGRERGF
jgi:hypothetical protein